MSAKSLMLIGALATFVSALGFMVIGPDGSLMVLAFGGGTLFGKGYGVYETRSHDKEPAP